MFGKYFLAVIPVSTFGLGVWQVKRWRWKLNLIEEMEKKVMEEPVEFPSEELISFSFSKLPELEYRKVRLRGKFDYSKQLIMGPRSLVAATDSFSGGMRPKANSGFHLITPFWVTDQSLAILVNRGWIPSKNYNTYSTEVNPMEVEIVGVVRSAEKRAPFMGKNMAAGPNSPWLYRDIPAMGEYLQTSNAFVDLASIRPLGSSSSSNSQPDSLAPIPGQTRVALRNDHVTYFITWFTLSFITGLMWHRLHILKKPLR